MEAPVQPDSPVVEVEDADRWRIFCSKALSTSLYVATGTASEVSAIRSACAIRADSRQMIITAV